jgi:hypothetical protein
MLCPNVFEHVLFAGGKSGNRVTDPQISVGRIPLHDKYCHECINNLEILTL